MPPSTVALAAALFQLIGNGDLPRVTAILVQSPTLVDSRNAGHATPVLWALYTRHPELLPVLLKYRQLDFFEACATGSENRAEDFLSKDAQLAHAYAPDGFTPLGLAVFFGHPHLAARLIAAGADVNAASRNAILVAPLHSAVANGNPALVKLLLAHGAFVDPVEFLGATPLHAAASEGKTEIVRLLLAAGADPSKKTKDGKTPASLAAQSHHDSLAAELTQAATHATPR